MGCQAVQPSPAFPTLVVREGARARTIDAQPAERRGWGLKFPRAVREPRSVPTRHPRLPQVRTGPGEKHPLPIDRRRICSGCPALAPESSARQTIANTAQGVIPAIPVCRPVLLPVGRRYPTNSSLCNPPSENARPGILGGDANGPIVPRMSAPDRIEVVDGRRNGTRPAREDHRCGNGFSAFAETQVPKSARSWNKKEPSDKGSAWMVSFHADEKTGIFGRRTVGPPAPLRPDEGWGIRRRRQTRECPSRGLSSCYPGAWPCADVTTHGEECSEDIGGQKTPAARFCSE